MQTTGVARVLVVEDGSDTRTSLREVLGGADFSIVEAKNGTAALRELDGGGCDIVFIDARLPEMDGFEVCRRIRTTSDVPVIIAAARTRPDDVLRGFEAGADDCVVEPMDIAQLRLRVRALLRRANNSTPPRAARLTFGDLEIRPDEARVLRSGNEIKLTKTEFKLLCELASAPDKVFSRESLLDRIWGYGYFGDGRLVDVHVRRLRTKIEPDPARPTHVVTVRGLGYRLQA